MGASQSKLEDSLLKALNHLNLQSLTLREEQVNAIRNIVENQKDVLVVLPTGFGKSLIFRLLPFVLTRGLMPRSRRLREAKKAMGTRMKLKGKVQPRSRGLSSPHPKVTFGVGRRRTLGTSLGKVFLPNQTSTNPNKPPLWESPWETSLGGLSTSRRVGI